MKWHRLAENPQSLEALYENVPDLENVELFSINLNREGSIVRIRFNLSRFPEHPSKRWHSDFNTVQVELAFMFVNDFRAQGWRSNMTVNIMLSKDEDLIKVELLSPKIDLTFSFSCEMFRIENITAYQDQSKIHQN